VVEQLRIDGCRASQNGQGKAQSAGNGMPFSRTAPKVGALGDAALADLGRSLRASQEAATNP